MLDRLRDHLHDTGLIPDGARVLVGWSGGADSTALLLLLKELGHDIVAGHLDHAQREESAAQAESFGAWCETKGIPFAGGRADVPAIARERKIGLEEAGREARYAFYASAKRATGCSLVATGHTRSDLAETVVFNLARGTGLAGLSGVPERRGDVVRPLLVFSREETEGYCRAIGYAPFEDPANRDLRHARARVRLAVMPELREINPAAEAAIARLAALAGEEDRFLDGAAAAALERAELPAHPTLGFLARDVEIAFDRRALEALPRVLFRRALRLAVGALGGSLDANQIATVEAAFAAGEDGSVTAEGGRVTIVYAREETVVRDLNPAVPARYPLAPHGETASEEFGWAFDAQTQRPTDAPPTRAAMEVELDRAKVKGGLFFRTLGAGDRMTPLGFDHARKLSDLLGEAGLSEAVRRRLPIVCDLVGPVWAPGGRARRAGGEDPRDGERRPDRLRAAGELGPTQPWSGDIPVPVSNAVRAVLPRRARSGDRDGDRNVPAPNLCPHHRVGDEGGDGGKVRGNEPRFLSVILSIGLPSSENI